MSPFPFSNLLRLLHTPLSQLIFVYLCLSHEKLVHGFRLVWLKQNPVTLLCNSVDSSDQLCHRTELGLPGDP